MTIVERVGQLALSAAATHVLLRGTLIRLAPISPKLAGPVAFATPWWDAVASVLQWIPAGVLSVPLLGERRVVGYDSRVKLRHELCRALKAVGAPERWDAIKRLEETAGQSIAHDPDLMMSWPQLRELLDAGVDVQPHTVTHPYSRRSPPIRCVTRSPAR